MNFLIRLIYLAFIMALWGIWITILSLYAETKLDKELGAVIVFFGGVIAPFFIYQIGKFLIRTQKNK